MAERLSNLDPPISVSRTKLADAVLARLVQERRPVITAYDLFQVLRELFTQQNRKSLYLRHDTPDSGDLRKVATNLSTTRALEVDADYGRSVYRVIPAGEAPAEEIAALANPFGYISHLSAMQRWGLTERRPDALHLTMPPAAAATALVETRMVADYGTPELVRDQPKLKFIRHPKVVRGRPISVYETRHRGRWLQVQDSHARLATVGQAFVDMVERPQYCGGMAHVIDVWEKHATVFQEEIIATLDAADSPIAKVRAGYLLDELIQIGDDSRVQSWARFAQRGGSRVLDPTKPFRATYSEKWMLSLNV